MGTQPSPKKTKCAVSNGMGTARRHFISTDVNMMQLFDKFSRRSSVFLEKTYSAMSIKCD